MKNGFGPSSIHKILSTVRLFQIHERMIQERNKIMNWSRLIGKQVLIYEDKITRKRPEGWAEIRGVTNKVQFGNRLCDVVFISDIDNHIVKRWVHEEQIKEHLGI